MRRRRVFAVTHVTYAIVSEHQNLRMDSGFWPYSFVAFHVCDASISFGDLSCVRKNNSEESMGN